MLPFSQVKDFSKSWKDGTAFSALIASLHEDYKYKLEEKKGVGALLLMPSSFSLSYRFER
tara:strand:- start:707 stop:886 length:180 start_codon:yes stop_codon:yes gene_type:complete